MRHAKAGRRLGRKTSHRIAMFRNMATSFFNHEKITTTDAKAKELRPIVEKLITLARRGDLHARRLVASYIRDPKTVSKLFSQIAPRYVERDGGYTRIIKLGIRSGDNADISIIELVEEALVKKTPKTKHVKSVSSTADPKTATSILEPVAPSLGDSESVVISNVSEEKCVASAD